MFLTLDYHSAIGSQITFGQCLKSIPNTWSKPLLRVAPLQRGFAIHFINVLPAGPTAAGETPFQIIRWNCDLIIDSEI